MSAPRSTGFRRAAPFLILLAAATAACSDDPAGPGGGPEDGAVTVNASTGWAFLQLGAAATPVPVADPATSDAWDIAFNATSAMLNGGAAGPGGVVGHCICRNAALDAAQVQTLTAGSQRAYFDGVDASDVPAAGDEWAGDTLTLAVSGWYSYDPVSHQLELVSGRSWKIRTAEGTAFAKLRIVSLAGASQATPGTVTIEYAVQPSASASLGAPTTAAIAVPAGGRAYFDLARGVAGDASDWDIQFDGWKLRVNAGSSGTGQAGATLAAEPFDAITTAADASPGAYRADTFAGVFNDSPWYRYDLDTHQIYPTYDVYLVRRGSAVHKIQIVGYYSDAGDPRFISLRHARIHP
jgi:hypothetical protein